MELLTSEGHSKSGDFWRHWFACAAIAVYGFQERQYFKIPPSDQRFLHTARFLDFKLVALSAGLVDVWETPCDPCLEYVNDSNLDFLNATEGSEAPQLIQPEDGRLRTWATEEGLETLAKFRKSRRFVIGMSAQQIPEKHIAMPNVVRLCLRWLNSNPKVHLKSLSIGSFPNQPRDFHKIIEHIGDLIVRMIILDEEFAKKLKLQFDSIMRGEDILVTRPEVKAKRGEKRPSQEESGYFCCAMVLLAIIGQRATYLLSGQDVKHCENEWPDVYLS